MSKKIQIDIEVNGKMTKATVDAKKLRGQLDGLDDAQQKTTKSGEKFQKGLKGVGEQSANASKNFSKFSAGMGGFVGVYASLAAQLFAISAGFQFLKRAGDLQALKTGQESYAAATGIAMRTLTKDIQNATNAQITFQDAAQAGAIGVAAGLSADQLTRLGSAAADASQILGRDVTDSFNRLIRGVTKAEPELLDELGIILRLKDATQIYADSIGKNANQLTQFEKSQAVANDVLTQAEEKYSRILEITGRAPNQFSQLGIAFDNVTNSIKDVVSTLAGPMATVLTKTPALAAAAFGLLLSGPLSAMGFSLKDIADNAEDSAKRQIKAIEKVETQQLKNKNVLKDRQKELRKLAEAEVTAGSSSKILKNLAKGGKLYGVDKANLRKALKAAEAQLREHGSITTGIFAGRDRAVLASFTTTLDQMDTAIEGTVSTWQKANLKIQGIWAQTTAFIQSGIAKITRGLNFFIRAAGFIGIAVFALQTLKEMFKDPLVQTEDEKRLAEQARAAEMARERLKGLVDEYKNFRVVQQVNFEFAKGNVDVLLNSAASLGNMLGTTFDAKNIKVFTDELINLRSEQYKVNESTRLYNQFVDTTAENIPFVSIAAKIADAAVGTDKFTGVVKLAVKGMANLAVVTGNFLNSIGFLDDDEIPTYQLSEGSVAAKANLERSIGALKDFQKQTDKMGVSGYKVFTEFDQLLEIGQRIADGSEVSADEVKRFQENMGATAAEAQRLAGNIKSLEEGAKAVAQAMAQVEGKMKGSTQGDLLRDAAVAQIKLMSDIAAERDDPSFTDAEKKRLALLNDQAMLGEEIAKHESKYKMLTISQQTASIRNYATMSQTRGKLLQQSDKIGAAELAGNKAQEERNRLFAYYTSEGRRITPEIQRQLDLLDATVGREEAKRKLAEEQLLTLVQQNTILERQETLRDDTKIASAQKVINQALEKEVSLRRQILDTKMKIARESINEAAADAEVANPFFDKERFVAEETLRLETETYALRAAQIEKEYQTKLQSIDLEYTLLDAKRVQTMLEMQKLALDLEAQKKGAQAQKAAEMAARLAGINYTGAKNAAIDMAAATREAALFDLEKGVRSAKRVVKSLEPMRQVMKTAADAFEGALNDSINAIFDSMSDKTMDLSEKLKDIGRNLMQSIQKAITQKLIVDPLLDMLGLGVADQAEKIAKAHSEGSTVAAAKLNTTFATGASQMQIAIAQALTSNKIKVCCCDPKDSSDPVAMVEALRNASFIIGGGFGGGINGGISEEERRNREMDAVVIAEGGTPPVQAATAAANDFFSTFSEWILGTKEDIVTLIEAGTGLGEIGDKLIIGQDITGAQAGNLYTAGVGQITEGASVGGFLNKIGDIFNSFSAALGKFFGVENSPFLKGLGDVLKGVMSNLGGFLKSGIDMLIKGVGKVLSSLAGGAGGGSWITAIMGMFGFKDGGIMNNGSKVAGYATGGIAKGPKSGHLAMLHGREAVVPLPNGNKIPVDMKGAGNVNTNNVSVSVNIASDGQAETSVSSEQGGVDLGKVISQAVTAELHKQKRPGGILSPIGAA